MGSVADKFYNEIELDNYKDNLKMFKEFIENFYLTIGANLDGLIPNDLDVKNSIDKFNYIKYLINTYLSKYRDVFYDLLSKSGYNMQFEMYDVMRVLGDQTNLKYATDIVDYLLESPYIDAIETDGPKIIVKSEKLGDQSFYSAKAYLNDNLDARVLLLGDLRRKCHQVNLELLDVLTDAVICTSLLPYFFKGNYYHSYLKINDMTIDPVNHIAMPSDKFYQLFNPYEITSLTKGELIDEYDIAINEGLIDESDGFYKPLAVALAKQLRNGGM